MTDIKDTINVDGDITATGKVRAVTGTANNELTTKKYVDDANAGKVAGPSSAVSDNVVLFDGTTGKLVKDSGKTLGASIPDPANEQTSVVGQALIVNSTGDGYVFGEAGRVDDVQIGGATIVDNKIATIPTATPSASGVVTVVRGTNDQTSAVPTDTKMQEYVTAAIEAMPEPMIFKGSVGTGGTITSLPAASASNEGFTYKVIVAGTYASQTAKVGDTFISTGSEWVLIPSGDEPSGTVTNIATGTGLTGGPITTSGTISHATSGITAGTYQSVTVNVYGHVTAGSNPFASTTIQLTEVD